jgi:hypothetical protein
MNNFGRTILKISKSLAVTGCCLYTLLFLICVSSEWQGFYNDEISLGIYYGIIITGITSGLGNGFGWVGIALIEKKNVLAGVFIFLSAAFSALITMIFGIPPKVLVLFILSLITTLLLIVSGVLIILNRPSKDRKKYKPENVSMVLGIICSSVLLFIEGNNITFESLLLPYIPNTILTITLGIAGIICAVLVFAASLLVKQRYILSLVFYCVSIGGLIIITVLDFSYLKAVLIVCILLCSIFAYLSKSKKSIPSH